MSPVALIKIIFFGHIEPVFQFSIVHHIENNRCDWVRRHKTPTRKTSPFLPCRSVVATLFRRTFQDQSCLCSPVLSLTRVTFSLLTTHVTEGPRRAWSARGVQCDVCGVESTRWTADTGSRNGTSVRPGTHGTRSPLSAERALFHKNKSAINNTTLLA